jgi:hypothetical protein
VIDVKETYAMRRAFMTLVGAAGAGALIWAATLPNAEYAGGYWARWALVAAAGAVLALSQLFGGWTKDGRVTFSPTVFALGFVPTLVVVGWVLAAGQPGSNTVGSHVRAWSVDIHANGLVSDFRQMLPALAFLLGATLALSFDTVAARTRVVEVPDRTAADMPLARERVEEPVPASRTPVTTTAVREEDLKVLP